MIAKDIKLKSFLSVTISSLQSGATKVPKNGPYNIHVFGTKYKLELEIDTDQVAKIKSISIIDLK